MKVCLGVLLAGWRRTMYLDTGWSWCQDEMKDQDVTDIARRIACQERQERRRGDSAQRTCWVCSHGRCACAEQAHSAVVRDATSIKHYLLFISFRLIKKTFRLIKAGCLCISEKNHLVESFMVRMNERESSNMSEWDVDVQMHKEFNSF